MSQLFVLDFSALSEPGLGGKRRLDSERQWRECARDDEGGNKVGASHGGFHSVCLGMKFLQT